IDAIPDALSIDLITGAWSPGRVRVKVTVNVRRGRATALSLE
ncbi:MAG: hypothetical protein QOK14_1897, partial [Frankiaceae bacterium]|nr:hypothetical protein [Frankiaceae bacterium]